MAANMIGVKKNIIIVNMGLIDVVMFNPVIISRRGRYETEGMPMYVTYSDPDRYLHCHSHRIVLYNLWEKKIAAHYCNSERLVNKTVL